MTRKFKISRTPILVFTPKNIREGKSVMRLEKNKVPKYFSSKNFMETPLARRNSNFFLALSSWRVPLENSKAKIKNKREIPSTLIIFETSFIESIEKFERNVKTRPKNAIKTAFLSKIFLRSMAINFKTTLSSPPLHFHFPIF